MYITTQRTRPGISITPSLQSIKSIFPIKKSRWDKQEEKTLSSYSKGYSKSTVTFSYSTTPIKQKHHETTSSTIPSTMLDKKNFHLIVVPNPAAPVFLAQFKSCEHEIYPTDITSIIPESVNVHTSQLLLNSRIVLVCKDNCPSCATGNNSTSSNSISTADFDQGSCGKDSCKKCWRCMFTRQIREWLEDDGNRNIIGEMEKHRDLILRRGSWSGGLL